ncbi:MAG TPA: type II secretion system protein [Burkholderiales bacterium]
MSGTESRNRIANPAFFGARRVVQTPPKRVRFVPGAKPLPDPKQRGFTYLALMIIIAVMGAGLAAIGEIYSHSAQREKERELLFIGHQFRDAIASYYNKSPGAKAYPKTLEDLIEDKRFPMPQHHLRKLYIDPMTGAAQWGLVEAPGGAGIMGVHSTSEARPIKTASFSAADLGFDEADQYTKWRFTYSPSGPVPVSR